MSHIHIISDLHFGHRNILSFRQEFSSIEEHDNTIVENICSVGRKRDQLWMLGDCFFDENSIKYLTEISKYFNTINFVPGNHDSDNKERIKVLKHCINAGMYNKVGSMFKVNGYWLTHPPIHPIELRGSVNVHGHVHSKTIRDPNFINVSCENVNYKPVRLAMLKHEEYRNENLVQYGF